MLRVVCHHCGNPEVGTAYRRQDWFFYEPRWRPVNSAIESDRLLVYSRRWPLSGPVAEENLTVDCRRHGVLSFNVQVAIEAARVGSVSYPSVVRAVLEHSE